MSNISKVRLAQPLEVDSTSNGEGLRMVLWFQGCFYECEGCHNPESWQLDGGKVYLIEDILKDIKKNQHCDGITFSGGDPLLQSEAVLSLLKEIKKLNLNVWLYSASLYEKLIKEEQFQKIAQYVDVLVDGPFVQAKLDYSLEYRGSSNQRLIDVSKSLESDKAILYNIKQNIK